MGGLTSWKGLVNKLSLSDRSTPSAVAGGGRGGLGKAATYPS
jgi:hypothetical protein